MGGDAPMPDPPRGGSRRRGSWEREAARFWRAAVACYAAALPLAAVGLTRSRPVWLGGCVALLAGLRCQRSAAFARRLAERDEDGVKADVPGD